MTRSTVSPNNIDAERAVLGSCIRNKSALGTAIYILRPEDFYDVNNRITFGVLRDMFMSDMPVDMLTLTTELKNRAIYDRLGGQAYIIGLTDIVTLAANVAYHCKIVHENAVRRQLIDAGQDITRLAASYEESLAKVLEGAEKLIFDAAQNKNSNEFRHSRDIISPVLEQINEKYREDGIQLTGYRTGFMDLDELTGGLQNGSLSIIAARPSMGKTALALNIAQFGGGNDNHCVLIFSLEMPAEQLVMRMIAAESGVNLSKLIRGTLDTTEFELVKQAAGAVAKRNIYINDATQLSAMEFLARARRFKTRHPDLALIVVDYLQLMSSGQERAGFSRNQEVSDISRMLKAAARETDCPVIALSQLSRDAEKRTDKKPQLSDLRDSGAIEQDADVVMMLYREDYYSENENNDLTDSKADVRVAKNRNGSTGVFHLTFRREITRFFTYGDEPPL